jgi:sulfate permease, SulP family
MNAMAAPGACLLRYPRPNPLARTRYRANAPPIRLRDLPGAALRASLIGYRAADLRRDLLAGVVVGIVALPLSMALAIAAGAPPQHGLYTAIVAGFVVAALGGSRTQVTGPTAAFIVILAPIQTRFGLGGLFVAGLMAGLMLMAMGALRLGKLIEYIPYPVTTGFTAGIGTVIAALQLKDFFGLRNDPAVAHPIAGDHFFERLGWMWQMRHTARASELLIGSLTLVLLVFLPRWIKRVPAPLVALPFAAVLAIGLHQEFGWFHVETIATRFGGIPRVPPLPILPWNAPGPGGQPLSLSFGSLPEAVASLGMLRLLLPSAFAIAMLGAIESLLSAVVSDGMAHTRHDPDAELLALGTGNVLVPFFGGIPATGAIARTATNIRSGGRTPIAAIAHALTVLAAVLLLAPLISWLPMASLAALLLLVAWNMSEAKHFGHAVRVAPKSDVAVLLTCYGLTVAFDMVIAVSVGIVLAALLFMRRMAEVMQTRVDEQIHGEEAPLPLPRGVIVYDVDGPLFFGAANRAMEALHEIADRAKVVILRLDGVPAMDSTGLVALESALARLRGNGALAIISGVLPQPKSVLDRAGVAERPGQLLIKRDFPAALDAAEDFLLGRPETGAQP